MYGHVFAQVLQVLTQVLEQVLTQVSQVLTQVAQQVLHSVSRHGSHDTSQVKAPPVSRGFALQYPATSQFSPYPLPVIKAMLFFAVGKKFISLDACSIRTVYREV